MADTTVTIRDETGALIPIRAVDNGDGTYSLSSALVATPTIDIGDVTLLTGSAVVGKVGIDQTTPGTTDSVTVKASEGVGSLTETAPVTDTASSGLNGRLQRLAQRITSLIALLPAALGPGAEAGAVLVTVATDSTGVLSVDDNGASLTIDNPALSVVGGGAQATAQRVALADESLAALESINVTVDFEGDPSDLDSGAGTDSHAVVGIAVAAAGGHAVITGDVANGLDVDVTRSVLPTGAATLAEQQTQTASLSVLDDWDETDRAKVNPVAGQVGLAAGTGLDVANALRVSLVTDIPLPVGANAIGKLAANTGVDIGDVDVLSIAAGDNNIGNVDVVTLPALPAGSNNIGDVDVLTEPATAADAAVGLPAVVKVVGGYDGANVQAISTDVNGRANVNVVDALPAGTNAIGKLAANSGVDIGDVDVLTLPAITIAAAQTLATVTTVGAVTAITNALPAGANNIGDVDIVTVPAPLNVTGGGVELGALRVTLANDSTGVVSVDDNGGNLSVDDGGNVLSVDWNGTVPPIGAGLEATALRVTLATDSTGLVSVDDNGSSLTVDVGTALPAGANNIGDVDILSIAAGDNNIGNVDVVTLPALPAGTNAIGKLAANSGVDIGDVDVTSITATTTVPTQITKTVAAIATPEALAADGTFFRTATVIAKKAARTANAGIVYLGIGSGNDTQPIPLNPNDIWEINAPLGQQYDLNDWYLDAEVAADGVMVVYS